MIDKRELRAGNIIECFGERVIDHLTEHGVHYTDGNGGNWLALEPIPLTPEWLLKFGFTMIEESYHDFPTTRDTFDKTKNVKRLDRTYFITQSDDRYEPDGTEMSILVILDPETKSLRSIGAVGVRDEFPHAELQYVHQLQNLYFALTGEELKIKD